MYNYQPNPTITQNRAQLKHALKTPITLVLAILIALTGIITIAFFASESDLSDSMEFIEFFFYKYFPNKESSAEGLYEASSAIIFLSAITAPILSFLGYLLTFTGSRSQSSQSPKAGTVLVMISAIISLVGISMLFLVYLSSLGTYMKLMDSRYTDDEAASRFLRVSLLAVSCLLYGISNLIFSCSLRGMCSGQKRSSGGAVFFAVSSIMVAFVYFAFFIDNTSENEYMSDQMSMGMAMIVLSAFTYAFSAVFAFIFNGRINSNPAPAAAYTNIPAAPVYPTHPTTNNAPATNSGYGDNYSSHDTPAPAFNPAEDTYKFPTVTENEAVVARTAVRDAEDVYETPAESSLPTPAFCPNCGTAVKPDQLFCAGCGNKLK